jgi:hypothetical protein
MTKFSLLLITLLLIAVLFIFRPNLNSKAFLSECTGHLEGNYHVHSKLEIWQDSEKIPIPANIGISGDCIHPLHTHDSTGIIHIDYPRKIQVTLGDFFDTMGIVFSDSQLGSLKKFDGFSFEVYVNDKLVKGNYRNIKLEDKQNIKILIKSPSP